VVPASHEQQLAASRGLDPQLIKDIEKQYGFDKPAHERLWLMLKSYARWTSATASSAAPPSPT
jgi:ABC-type microcin C transport system permease subunit YejB